MADQNEKIKAEKTSEELVKVRPTLFIGVGGTGMEVSLRVRRRILNYVWGNRENPVRLTNLSEFPLAQFVNFDLAVGETESGKATATDPLSELVKFSEEEKLVLKLDMDKYLRSDGELNRHPYIASWFPLTRKKALELGIDPTKGAGQIRSLSRLYFFDKYGLLRSMLNAKIGALLAGVDKETKTKRLGLELEPASLRVVVIASSAGGTGSGSFLDMGYLAKWLANTQIGGGRAEIHLALMLPSGYSGFGKSRTEANSYAALMELEASIGQGLKYVEGWKYGENMDNFPDKPYDDIFLFDTGNLAHKRTANANDLFDMVADILFEDFTSEEFATRKRSTSVNQSQKKAVSFHPFVDKDKYGSMKLMYSKAYSSFGQSIIDTQLEQRRDEIACGQVNDMLKVFFGIASETGIERKVPPPTPDEARDILRDHIYCNREDFKLAYQFVSDATPYKKGEQISIRKIIDHLLYDGDKSIIGRMHDRINKNIDEILASTEKDQRLIKVDKLRGETDRDLGIEGGAADAGARGIEDIMRARRNYVFQNLIDEKSSLIKALWAAVDNKEKGGLDYTIKLIERIKDEIENDVTGILPEIKKAQEWFAGLCEKLRGGELQILKEHINQTKGSGLFGMGGSKDAHAESKLQQIGETIRWYVEARLRELACKEAVVLLKDLSLWLGQHQGLDEKTNKKRWAPGCFCGKLVGYEKLVVAIMSSMNEEVIRTREATKQGHAAYQVITASTKELDAARRLDPKKAMEWAKNVFDNLGGSRKIFEKLENDQSRAELVGQLRGLALSGLPSLEGGQSNPLIKTLQNMKEEKPDELRHLFQRCLEMAMPWVMANLGGEWTVENDQYVCIVGVSGAETFKQQFGAEFAKALPSRAGMTAEKITYRETGVPGKLTCYVELSGIPLTALSLLSTWRDSYNEEDKLIPVHTHKDKALFVHPMAPSSGTLDRLADQFMLYLQGIALGVLKLRVDSPQERRYCITVSGEQLSIGDERDIRMDGISSSHLVYLQKRVADSIDRLKTPVQLAGLAVLYDFYAKNVYPPKITEGKTEEFENSFGNVMCTTLRKETIKTLKKKSGVADINMPDMIARLKGNNDPEVWENYEALDIWTNEIEGSESDVNEREVGRSHRPKRVLKSDFFQPGWLESHLNIGTSKQEPKRPSGGGAQPAIAEWWVAVNGQKNGPHNESGLSNLIANGMLTVNTKVWKKGMSGWVPVNQVNELMHLFDQPPPLDDEPPPID
jgi:hypothetical protein